MHDRPIKPLDTAVYWIEYAARNGRCEHFRSAALDLAWYQRALLDIAVFLIAIVLILTSAFYYIFKRFLCTKKQKTD